MKVIQAFNQSHIAYNIFVDRKKEDGNNLSNETLTNIQKMSHQRLGNLERLKTQISKLQSFLHPERYKQVMSSLENEIALASMLENDCISYLDTQEPKYLESVVTGLTEEKEYSDKLSTSFSIIENQFGILAVGMALSNQMSIEDIRDLASSLEKGSNLQQNMEQLVITLERKNQNVQEQQVQKEEPTIEEAQEYQEEQEQMTAPAPTSPSVAPQPTFGDRLAQINYKLDGNMVAEVQELTVERRMKEIAMGMSQYANKEKLSLRDMIELYTLQQEQIQLEAYADTLDEQKLSRSERKRNKLMKNATNKLEENKRLLEQSKQNYQKYDSKAMRFFSARYQEQMAVNIEKLNQKRGMLQAEQRRSAIVKFNKNSGKMARKSRTLGTILAVDEFKNSKLEELRALREQVISEFQNFRQDFRRFKSDRKKLPELQQASVIMPDNIISLEEYKRTHERNMTA